MEFVINNGVLEDIVNPETDVVIPFGVTSLSPSVFDSNKVTKNVYFPASLTDCGKHRSICFRHQENIYVDPDNPVYSSYNGVLYNKEQTILINCPVGKKGKYKTSPTTKIIARDAFCCSNLKELVLNNGLKRIHRWAFADDCIQKPILIPRSVSHISSRAFAREYSLGSVIVYPGSYAHEYAKDNKYIRFCCKQNIFDIANKVIDTTISSLMKSIKKIWIKKSNLPLYTLKRDVLELNIRTGGLLHRERFGYGLIWSLYDDGTLKISGFGAMPDYINHWDSYFGEGQPPWIGCEKYGVMPYKLVIDNGITYIGNNAFESFGCLKEVYIADTVTKLGKMSFFDCFHIDKINIPTHMDIENFDYAELPLYHNKQYDRIGNILVKKK